MRSYSVFSRSSSSSVASTISLWASYREARRSFREITAGLKKYCRVLLRRPVIETEESKSRQQVVDVGADVDQELREGGGLGGRRTSAKGTAAERGKVKSPQLAMNLSRIEQAAELMSFLLRLERSWLRT